MKKLGKVNAPVWGVLIRWGGEDQYFLGCVSVRRPIEIRGFTTALAFETRKQAREYIKAQFGYLARRADLRARSHNWRMPVPIKLRITVEPW